MLSSKLAYKMLSSKLVYVTNSCEDAIPLPHRNKDTLNVRNF